MERYAQRAWDYREKAVSIYSPRKLLNCGAQFARTLRTAGSKRTRKPRSGGKQSESGGILGQNVLRRGPMSAALHARELLAGTDTDHFVIGYAPFGGAVHLESSAAWLHGSVEAEVPIWFEVHAPGDRLPRCAI